MKTESVSNHFIVYVVFCRDPFSRERTARKVSTWKLPKLYSLKAGKSTSSFCVYVTLFQLVLLTKDYFQTFTLAILPLYASIKGT